MKDGSVSVILIFLVFSEKHKCVQHNWTKLLVFVPVKTVDYTWPTLSCLSGCCVCIQLAILHKVSVNIISQSLFLNAVLHTYILISNRCCSSSQAD